MNKHQKFYQNGILTILRRRRFLNFHLDYLFQLYFCCKTLVDCYDNQAKAQNVHLIVIII